jgi:hypothetical protein
MRYVLLFLILAMPAFAQSSVYIDQIGSNNTTLVEQNGYGNKTAIILNRGDNNNLTIMQENVGNQTAFIGTPPTQPPTALNNQSYVFPTNNNNSNNTLSIIQIGGSHTAAINLDPTVTTSNNTATILQSGSANKSFNLSLSGSSIVANITQDSATVPDAASMSIQCLTPPCGGYSYTKH